MTTAICITGMHRSGTSLTASWLERCGLVIHDGSLIAPAAGNRLGHFEDREFVVLHAAALDEQGLGGSMGWKASSAAAVTFPPARRAEAEELVRRRDAKFPVWGWKDPRSVLFLDEWKAIVPELKVLFVWRPAVDVVESLVRRSRRTRNPDMKARTLAAPGLWKVYNQRLLDYRRRHPSSTVLIPFSALVDADRQVLELVERRFDVQLPYRPLADLYDEGLRRHRPVSVSRSVSGLAASLTGCAAVERDLQEASDSPLGTTPPPALRP
ncbi:MAG TPA: sulfotransferase [Acidimicrobiales bacterium]|nr:sulfotransferase [Acidimicrobiales bacterium]